MTAFIVQRQPPRSGREGGRQLDYWWATLSPGPHLCSLAGGCHFCPREAAHKATQASKSPSCCSGVPLGNGLWCQKGERFWSPCAPGFPRLHLKVLTKVTAGQVYTLTVPTSKRPHTARYFCHPLGGKTNCLWTWTCPSSCEYPHICCRNATAGTQGGAHIAPGELDSERPRLCSPGATQSIPRPGVRVGRGLPTVGGDLWQVSSQRGG